MNIIDAKPLRIPRYIKIHRKPIYKLRPSILYTSISPSCCLSEPYKRSFTSPYQSNSNTHEKAICMVLNFIGVFSVSYA